MLGKILAFELGFIGIFMFAKLNSIFVLLRGFCEWLNLSCFEFSLIGSSAIEFLVFVYPCAALVDGNGGSGILL